MQLSADAHIPFPRETVFRAYRDDMVALVAYLPNVRSIEVTSRKDDGAVVELVNEWRGGGDVPAAVRALLGDSVLSWTDYAKWNAEAMFCDWRTETHAFKEALRCGGRNAFLEDGPGKTLLEIRGSLEVDAKKIRGVPSFSRARRAERSRTSSSSRSSPTSSKPPRASRSICRRGHSIAA
jgi:hypothetical protein